MTSLENIFIPIVSPFLSVLMIIGLHFLGSIIIRYLKIEKIISNISDLKFQYSMVGSIFLTFFIYPFVVLNFFNIYFLKIISLLIIFLGIYFFLKHLNFSKLKIFSNKKIEFKVILIFLIVVGFFILCLGPITSADSLDYHIGVPLYILNNNTYPFFKFWMHFPKSGSGEILNTIGLINHAEQFPALVQFSAILSLVGILIKKTKNVKIKDNYILLLLVLSSPVLIFLVSSAKIQLLYVGASSLIFALIFFNNENCFKNTNFLIFSIILLMSAVTAKFSFALSSFLLWSSIFFYCYKKKNLKKFLILSLLIFLITLLPRSIYRMDLYDVNFIDSVFKPLPLNLYGYEQLYVSLTSCGYHGCWPYWLVFPKDLSSFTEALGIGSLAILFVKIHKKRKFYLIIIILLLQIILSKSFGQNNARWFLEPLIWSILIIKYYNFRNQTIKNLFGNIISIQSIFIILAIWFGVFTLSVGSISYEKRDKVLEKTADGYELFKWSNEKLNNDDVLISTHRSFSLSNTKTIPGDLFSYIDISNKKSQVYFEEIKKLKPTHILFYEDKKNYDKLSKCLGDLAYYKKNVGKKASRNPINASTERYDGYIYTFNYWELPNCVLN